MTEQRVLYNTISVCPICLREIPAGIVAEQDGIYMEKTCPEHGSYKTLVWESNAQDYLDWLRCGGTDVSALPHSREAARLELSGYSADCAACSQPSSSALMTTNRCNMDCPVCFTRDKKEPLHEPDLDECRRLLALYRESAGADAIVELCGGEPTVRQDICDLAALARDMGFDFIQLNTNGIKLAESEDFCKRLKESGVTTVYLGFDGVTEKPYLAKYGKPMLETKKRAVSNCAAAGLAVVLVACVIPNENDGELGAIVDYAAANIPAVKGVFFQPISYFGIYPPDELRRVTIPAILRSLESQNPQLNRDDFNPGSYEHPQCSFNACYMQDKYGVLKPLTRRMPNAAAADVHRLRQTLRSTWLPSHRRMLTVGGMAFQDAWNLDLLRLRRCSIQIIQSDGRLVPLCGKYLSACDGSRLLPGIG